MRWRLRHGTGLVAATALALTPVLTAAQPPLVDGAPRPAAGWVDVLPNLPEGEGVAAGSPLPQEIAPQTTLVAKEDRNREIRVEGPRGSRVWTASALASHDLPQAALDAYKRAAATMAGIDPDCRLPWTLLAGIGRVESDHGRYGGSVLSTDGVSRPAIIGVALDGKGPVAAIRDSDDGKMDSDQVWDRAVGPMQFIPTTWAYAGRDGDGDGEKNPHDLDDAALAAAGYLCSGSGSLLDDATAKAAILRYNPSDYYVALVQAFERGYRTGVFVMPSPPPPPEDEDRPRKKRGVREAAGEGRKGDKSASPTRAPKSSGDGGSEPATSAPKPSPKPSPTPTKTPSPSLTPDGPVLVTVAGMLTSCNGGWCVGGTTLVLGPASQNDLDAASDYDGDGTVGTNSEELDGLVGRDVTVQVEKGTGVLFVINGMDYRYADGSFS